MKLPQVGEIVHYMVEDRTGQLLCVAAIITELHDSHKDFDVCLHAIEHGDRQMRPHAHVAYSSGIAWGTWHRLDECLQRKEKA